MADNAEAILYYRLLQKTGRLKDVLLCEFRCPSGCLLVQIFQTPKGVAVYHPVFTSMRGGEVGRQLGGYVSSVTPAVGEGNDRRWGGGETQGSHSTYGECHHDRHWQVHFTDTMLLKPGNPTRRIVDTHD